MDPTIICYLIYLLAGLVCCVVVLNQKLQTIPITTTIILKSLSYILLWPIFILLDRPPKFPDYVNHNLKIDNKLIKIPEDLGRRVVYRKELDKPMVGILLGINNNEKKVYVYFFHNNETKLTATGYLSWEKSKNKNNKTQILPATLHRVETGSVKFGNDWTGLFIRGDNAMYYAHHLNNIKRTLLAISQERQKHTPSYHPLDHEVLNQLIELLKETNETT
jgi:hypothetical protein